MNSRNKGKNGELELAERLRDYGIEARRGWSEGKDITHAIEGVHLECKRVERSQPYVWLDQAIRDAKGDEIPVVVHRQNRKDWIAILDLGDLIEILRKSGMC